MTLLLTKKLCAYCTPINGVTQEKAQFDKKKSPVQPMQPAGGGEKAFIKKNSNMKSFGIEKIG